MDFENEQTMKLCKLLNRPDILNWRLFLIMQEFQTQNQKKLFDKSFYYTSHKKWQDKINNVEKVLFVGPFISWTGMTTLYNVVYWASIFLMSALQLGLQLENFNGKVSHECKQDRDDPICCH